MAQRSQATPSRADRPVLWSLTLPFWAARAERPGSDASGAADWRLRLRVRAARRSLDREIAQGASLVDDPARAVRARQLRSSSERRAIAACLANILDAAQECQADPGCRLALNHAAVLGARVQILAIIETLRCPYAVSARGVALARGLTASLTGPLVADYSDATLRQASAEIIDALGRVFPGPHL